MLGSQGWRRAMVAAIAAATMLVGASVAQAAPTWLAPTRVGPITEPSCVSVYECDAEIAVAPDGTAYLAAVNYDGTPANNLRVSVSVRPPGGSFGPLQYLSPANENAFGFSGEAMDIAVDRNGNATVVWSYSESDSSTNVVQAAYRPAGASTFRSAETLSNPAHSADLPSVAVSDNGGAVVVWRNTTGGLSTVQRSFRNPGALAFGSLGDISSPAVASIDDPRVAMAPNGNAVAVWAQGIGVAAMPRAAGQDFSVPLRQFLAQGGANSVASEPEVAIAPNGQATAVWTWDDDTTVPPDAIIQSRERTASPTFSTGFWNDVDPVTAPTETGISPSVAVDGLNTAVAVWSGTIGGQTRVRSAVRSSGGSFTDHAPISGPQSSAFGPQVNMSPQGVAVATWSLGVSNIELVQTARRPAGGSFGQVDTIMQGTPSPNFKGVLFQPAPTVAFDAEGNAFATWVGWSYTGFFVDLRNFIEVAGFDAAPPAITAASVPNTGTTGQAVGMSAAAGDRMTGTSISWSFGDGGSAPGASVSHAYGAAGVYTVTIFATDAVGNQSSTTRTIQISNPAPPPPPPPTPRIRGVRLSFDYLAFDRYTKFTRLEVKGVPRGTTVKASCKFKKKKCPKKARKGFTKRRARGTVSLNKRYKGVKLKVGTKITVKVTKPGSIGAAKILTIRKAKVPKVVDRCMAVGSTKLRKRC